MIIMRKNMFPLPVLIISMVIAACNSNNNSSGEDANSIPLYEVEDGDTIVVQKELNFENFDESVLPKGYSLEPHIVCKIVTDENSMISYDLSFLEAYNGRVEYFSGSSQILSEDILQDIHWPREGRAIVYDYPGKDTYLVYLLLPEHPYQTAYLLSTSKPLIDNISHTFNKPDAKEIELIVASALYPIMSGNNQYQYKTYLDTV